MRKKAPTWLRVKDKIALNVSRKHNTSVSARKESRKVMSKSLMCCTIFSSFFLIADGKIRYQQFHFSSVSSQSATVKWDFDYSWRF
ncbi:hypothetical protein ACLK19_14455 [Escherichia coli]